MTSGVCTIPSAIAVPEDRVVNASIKALIRIELLDGLSHVHSVEDIRIQVSDIPVRVLF